MAVDIQATGFIGIAFEATQGTYTAPTKFFPITTESLTWQQDNQERRLIRGVADRLGIIGGNVHIEGDIEMECLHDVLPYFMYASRNTIVKSGSGPYVYTATPFHSALPTTARTLSVTVVRDGLAFGYTGCVVGSLKLNTDSGVLKMTASVIGRDEASQTLPSSPTFSVVNPFGPGSYTISNPTGTPVLDADTLELDIEDNATPEFRLSTTRGAQYVRFGERNVQLKMSRDFVDRTELDAWKAITARSVTVLATAGAYSVQAKLAAAIKSAYDLSGLGSQGDLVRAEITYEGIYDPSTSKSYELIVTTSENIT